MGLEWEYTNGQTPIDENEKAGLLIETISTHNDLNEFEQQNIEEALHWVFGKKLKPKEVFTEKFIRNVHKRMFGKVWAWAGSYRKTDKNLGIDKVQIPLALKVLCDDALYWVANETFSPEEIAIRFKHRIVSIHCFSNGNGRHSRLMGDIIIENLFGSVPFSWGSNKISNGNNPRDAYLKAVKSADQGDYGPLLEFARS